jgi:CheY-like chemotaxis protein
MPPDILAKVFDPFFTTKGEGKGTGLGLSQVHGFVHQSGGGITIASEMGQGTRITLYLPRTSADMHADAPAETQSVSAGACKVLLVEDNPDVAEVTGELLAHMGCETEKVGDAAAALEAVEGGEFDLMLSDIVMAGPMNGLDLGRAVRKKHPDLLVVLATGYSDAAGQAGAEFTVLRKPYNVADLDQAIGDARRRQAARQRKVVDFSNTKRERAAKGK